MTALLFGSISTVADTSELQRQAFNDAFRAHGLNWEWERDDYVAMLEESGGRDRIARYAASKDQEEVDADAVHQTKSELFQKAAATAGLTPRSGVAEAIREAKGKGMKVALVTTTSEANVAALLQALDPAVQRSDFDLVVDSSSVSASKPDPAAYAFALDQLAQGPGDCVAIEDNRGGVAAATAAGITCVAFPNTNTAGHEFDGAAQRVEQIDLAELQQLIGSK